MHEIFSVGPRAGGLLALLAVFPTIEEEALITRRPAAGNMAVVVGLSFEAAHACLSILDTVGAEETVDVIVTAECAAAADVLNALRPSLAVVSCELRPTEQAILTAAAKTHGAHVVWVTRDLDAVAIERLLRPAAAVAFSASRYRMIPDPEQCPAATEVLP